MYPKILVFVRSFYILFSAINTKLFVSCLNVSEVDHLYTKLLTNYNRKLLPLLNQSEAAEVGISVYIGSLNKFDELTGEFALTLLLSLTWREERMTWNPEDFDGKRSLLISPEDIWRPKTFVRQSYNTLKEVGNQSDMLRITSDGVVDWIIATVVKVACSVDVTFFPFDSQTCKVTFTTLSVRTEEMKLYALYSTAGSTHWEKNSQWTLLNTSITDFAYPNGPSGINIYVTLKRRSEFYIIYIVIPLIFLGKINNLVFSIPPNSGERSSVAITAFLSFAVYMQIVNNSVPQSSAPIAIIYYYLMFLLIYSSFIMLMCIISMRIYDKKGEVPAMATSIVLFLRCSYCKTRKKTKKVIALEMNRIGQDNPEASNIKQKSESVDQKITWAYVGKTFDIYCALFNFLFFVGFTWGVFVSLYFNAEFLK